MMNEVFVVLGAVLFTAPMVSLVYQKVKNR